MAETEQTRQTGRKFLEDCVGQNVKYADSFRKKIFEGTLEYDSNIGMYYIATGGRLKPIVCLQDVVKDFIVDNGEILDTDGRYESLDSVFVVGCTDRAIIEETDKRFGMKRRLTVETETGKILYEDSGLLY